jgi:hypothetical protein
MLDMVARLKSTGIHSLSPEILRAVLADVRGQQFASGLLNVSQVCRQWNVSVVELE